MLHPCIKQVRARLYPNFELCCCFQTENRINETREYDEILMNQQPRLVDKPGIVGCDTKCLVPGFLAML